MVATVPSMIGQFNMDNISILLDMGYQVDVASDFKDTSIWPKEKTKQLVKDLKSKGVRCIQVNFSRNPLDIVRHINSYRRILELIKTRNYSFIHTHTPIASVIARLCARKTKTKVIYTAHGFHFYTGGPIKNWIVFYPIEKWLSRYTDILITINKEDYIRAREHFHAKRTVYVPGVGIDTERFLCSKNDHAKDFVRKRVRQEIGIPLDAKVIVSVGELSRRKNHKIVVEALQKLPDDYWYVIVGIGQLSEELSAIDKTKRLKLIGYRTDVVDILNASDVFAFPSLQEGLPVALMEAVSVGLPCVVSRIRGNTDLVKEEKCWFEPNSVNSFYESLNYIISMDNNTANKDSSEIKKIIDIQMINKKMRNVYKKVIR